MTKRILFGVLDAPAGYYRSIFPALSIGEATRSFSDVANNPETDIGRHAGDFSLYRLADWDDNSGIVTPLDRPELIINAASLRVRPIDIVPEQIEG